MHWQLYLIWLAIASFVTFLMYGYDKSQAKRKGWRVPEAVLHALALAGGFAGGWMGRALFRHKTPKGIFGFVLTMSTAIYLGMGYWLFLR